MPPAVPTNHDDHHGRLDGHVAPRAWTRRGRRSPASARPGGGRRAACFTVADPVHHAGGLSLSRIISGLVATPEKCAAGQCNSAAFPGAGTVELILIRRPVNL